MANAKSTQGERKCPSLGRSAGLKVRIRWSNKKHSSSHLSNEKLFQKRKLNLNPDVFSFAESKTLGSSVVDAQVVGLPREEKRLLY